MNLLASVALQAIPYTPPVHRLYEAKLAEVSLRRWRQPSRSCCSQSCGWLLYPLSGVLVYACASMCMFLYMSSWVLGRVVRVV